MVRKIKSRKKNDRRKSVGRSRSRRRNRSVGRKQRRQRRQRRSVGRRQRRRITRKKMPKDIGLAGTVVHWEEGKAGEIGKEKYDSFRESFEDKYKNYTYRITDEDDGQYNRGINWVNTINAQGKKTRSLRMFAKYSLFNEDEEEVANVELLYIPGSTSVVNIKYIKNLTGCTEMPPLPTCIKHLATFFLVLIIPEFCQYAKEKYNTFIDIENSKGEELSWKKESNVFSDAIQILLHVEGEGKKEGRAGSSKNPRLRAHYEKVGFKLISGHGIDIMGESYGGLLDKSMGI